MSSCQGCQAAQMASFSWPLNTASSRIMRASYTRSAASRDALRSQLPLPFQRTCGLSAW